MVSQINIRQTTTIYHWYKVKVKRKSCKHLAHTQAHPHKHLEIFSEAAVAVVVCHLQMPIFTFISFETISISRNNQFVTKLYNNY